MIAPKVILNEHFLPDAPETSEASAHRTYIDGGQGRQTCKVYVVVKCYTRSTTYPVLLYKADTFVRY